MENFLNEANPEVDILQLTKEVPNEPSSDEEKLEAISKQIEESDLAPEYKEKLHELFSRYLDVIGLDYNDLKQTKLVKCYVDTGDAVPIMKRPNKHMSHSELQTFRLELAKMLKTGQIIPTIHVPKRDGSSSFGWAFPAMYVGKKLS